MSPHPRSVDPAEENDADDEGEIWYNPIPEDEEPETSHRPSIRLLVPPRVELQRRPSRGADVGHCGRNLGGGGGGGGPEVLGESLSGGGGGGGSVDGSQGNAVHSTDALHLHRQMLACKPQEEGGPSTSRATGKTHLLLPFLNFFMHSRFSGLMLEGQLSPVVLSLSQSPSADFCGCAHL